MQQNTINFTHIEGDFRFLHICLVKKFEINPHVDEFWTSPHLSWQEFEISPHDRFFLHGHRPWVRDKYQVWFGENILKLGKIFCHDFFFFSERQSLAQAISALLGATILPWCLHANARFLNGNLFTQIGLLVSGIWFVLAISTSEMHVAPQISQTATDCHCTD